MTSLRAAAEPRRTTTASESSASVLERLERENAALAHRITLLRPALHGLVRDAANARRELARLRAENRELSDRLAGRRAAPPAPASACR